MAFQVPSFLRRTIICLHYALYLPFNPNTALPYAHHLPQIFLLNQELTMYGPNPQFPPFVPIPTSPKRGHRFDRAMAANRQRAQSSGSRGIGQTTSLTSNSETNAAALCLISEKKALLAEAEAQESAAREMYYYAQNESWWLGSPDSYQVSDSDDTTYSEHEYRERQEAEEREKAARRELRLQRRDPETGSLPYRPWLQFRDIRTRLRMGTGVS